MGNPYNGNFKFYLRFQLGRGARAPLLPYYHIPYELDFEESLAYKRWIRDLYNDMLPLNRILQNVKQYHPQRELNDGIIQDAEYFQEFEKRIEENRHAIALRCVELGIYKDVYEAK